MRIELDYKGSAWIIIIGDNEFAIEAFEVGNALKVFAGVLS